MNSPDEKVLFGDEPDGQGFHTPEPCLKKERIAALRCKFGEDELLSVLLSTTAESLIIIDQNSSILIVNNKAQELLCWDNNCCIGKKIDEVLDLSEPKTGEVLEIKIDNLQEKENCARAVQKHVRLRTKQGKKMDVLLKLHPFFGKNQCGILIVLEDISALTHKEEELSKAIHQTNLFREELIETELKLNSILNGVPVGTILLDVQEKEIVLLNSIAQKFLKHIEIARSFESIFKFLVARHLTEIDTDRRYSMTFNDNTYGYSLYLVGERYICIHMRDITDDIFVDSVTQNVTMTADINKMFSSIRHEIGNPLSILKTTLLVLEENITTFDEDQQKRYFDRLKSALGTIEELLSQLKSYHMYQNMDLEPIDIVSFIAEFIDQFQDKLKEHSTAISLKFAESEIMVMANYLGLKQIFNNLISNALDALNDTSSPRISLSCSLLRNRVMIKISDNGSGISEEDLPHIFTPLFTNKRHGTGLGLSIVKKILTLMNGTIFVKNNETCGIEVTFTLTRCGC